MFGGRELMRKCAGCGIDITFKSCLEYRMIMLCEECHDRILHGKEVTQLMPMVREYGE